ncbi:hypothetical protein Bpfe_019701 [Biomphalaria pfeifferi]|uniref:Uncharacterized protein n=1 Tax=Biomphalaria pfeifferi TaxID=112525 RepID=A0AAD8F492_BIOPF|nr:hypothetical protein Bpfe_019701 [Biomphalaria pfeifferi]
MTRPNLKTFICVKFLKSRLKSKYSGISCKMFATYIKIIARVVLLTVINLFTMKGDAMHRHLSAVM